MTSSPAFLPLADEAGLLREALDGLAIGLRACTCAHRYHALWSVLKAAGVHRGIHAESAGLAAVLRPLLEPRAHVLIAGTADASALQLLAACADAPSQLRFTIADRCPAPLRRAADHADAHGLAVTTRATDLACIATDDPWDLVFMHYTLSFADGATRQRVLGAIAGGLAPGGHVVCVAKFGDRAAAVGSAVGSAAGSGQTWLAPLQPKIAQLLAGHPDALAEVDALLPGYARSRDERASAQPSPAELAAEFASAGLEMCATHATTRSAWTRSAAFPTVDRQESMILVAVHAPAH